MFAKRLVLALAALAVMIPLTGCRNNRCCKSNSVSAAPSCCPAPGALPPGVLPPAGF
ncbi:MAG TPA: hypothetical protein VD866_16145 [Urbifossiella sp.]|nr:hypothetical protein [Urbifossiella sp.]